MSDGSKCDKGRSLLKNCFVTPRKGSERHGTTLLSVIHIPQVSLYMTGLPKSTSTTIFSTMPNQALTCKPPVRAKRSIAPKSNMGFLLHNVNWVLTGT